MTRLGSIVLLALLIPGCGHYRHHSHKHHAIQEIAKMPKEGQYFQVQQGENGEKEYVLIVPKRKRLQMTQVYIHIHEAAYDDLFYKIGNAINELNDDGFMLIDIQYFNMEREEGHCHAFLLFNEVKDVKC